MSETIVEAAVGSKSAVLKGLNDIWNDILLAGGIQKLNRNTQPGASYFYRGIDQVYNTLSPLFAEHKVLIRPTIKSIQREERESQNGKALYFTFVEVDYEFISQIDGSTFVCGSAGEAMDTSDKSLNKAMTAAFKYLMFYMFMIPVDIVDADGETPEAASTKSRPSSQPSQQQTQQRPSQGQGQRSQSQQPAKTAEAKPKPKAEPKVWDNNATAEFMNRLDGADDVTLHQMQGELLQEKDAIGQLAAEMSRGVCIRRAEVVTQAGFNAFQKVSRLLVKNGLLTQEEFLSAINMAANRLNLDLVTK